MIDIAILEAAGLSASDIIKVIKADQLRQAEGLAAQRERKRIYQRNQRAREKEACFTGFTGLTGGNSSEINDRGPMSPVTADNVHILTSLLSSSLKKERKKVTTNRGTRLPEGWRPSEVEVAFGRSLGMTQTDIDGQAARFCDYWVSRPGAGGVKISWVATWRNWCRTFCEKAGRAPVQLNGSPVGGYWIGMDTAEWDAWSRHRGKPFSLDKRGGWTAPTQWPPGFNPKMEAAANEQFQS